jgi:hypothetical protein
MTLQSNLEKFRTNYPVTKCLVGEDSLTYIFQFYYNASKAAHEANLLIEKLNLPLVAIHKGSCAFFTIQSNEYEG